MPRGQASRGGVVKHDGRSGPLRRRSILMTSDKVNAVLRHIIKSLRLGSHMPRRAGHEDRFPAQRQALDHALWMAEEALTFPPEKIEKKMRWLGFVQGALWCHGGESIQELKEQNMPDEEKR
jgi:hypothetical protein